MPDGLLGTHGQAPGFFEIYPDALEVAQLEPVDKAHIQDVGQAAQLAALAQARLGPVEEAKAAHGIPDGMSGHAQQDQSLDVVDVRAGL